MAIKNIILDLGGVIINIDYTKTLEAFRQLGVNDIEAVFTQNKQNKLFDDCETGKIGSSQFRADFKSQLGVNISDETFDSAWNAMLLDLPMQRLNFIRSLSEQGYRVFLFSNTNEIHLSEVFRICQDQNNIKNFDPYFEKQYYSHTFGLRKPNPEAFLTILNENKLNPNETLFIDDTERHVLGARSAGIHAVHLTKDKSIFGIPNFIEHLSEENLEDKVNVGCLI